MYVDIIFTALGSMFVNVTTKWQNTLLKGVLGREQGGPQWASIWRLKTQRGIAPPLLHQFQTNCMGLGVDKLQRNTKEILIYNLLHYKSVKWGTGEGTVLSPHSPQVSSLLGLYLICTCACEGGAYNGWLWWDGWDVWSHGLIRPGPCICACRCPWSRSWTPWRPSNRAIFALNLPQPLNLFSNGTRLRAKCNISSSSCGTRWNIGCGGSCTIASSLSSNDTAGAEALLRAAGLL